jgi:hypothetical protein
MFRPICHISPYDDRLRSKHVAKIKTTCSIGLRVDCLMAYKYTLLALDVENVAAIVQSVEEYRVGERLDERGTEVRFAEGTQDILHSVKTGSGPTSPHVQ